MKLLFDKLKTSDGIVRVSFDGEVTWNEYNVADVKDTGITFTEDECPDLTKIRIAGAITKIGDIKTHIVNESISQDLTADEKIENLRIQINNLANNSSNEEITTLKNRFENYLWTQATTKNMTWEGATVAEIYNFKEFTKTIPFNTPIRICQGNEYLPVTDITPSTDVPNIAEILTAISGITSFSDFDNNSLISNDYLETNFSFNTNSQITLHPKQFLTAADIIGYDCIYDKPIFELTSYEFAHLLTGSDDIPNDDIFTSGSTYQFDFFTNGLLSSLLDINSYTFNIDNMINNLQSYRAGNHYTSSLSGDFVIEYFDNYFCTSDMLFYLIDDYCIPAEGQDKLTSFLIRLTTLILQKCKEGSTSISQWLYLDLFYWNNYNNITWAMNMAPYPQTIAWDALSIYNKLYITKDDNNLILKTYYQGLNTPYNGMLPSYKELPF